jgi:drug/metabolite transporter (DMT)-like permease
MRVSPVQPTTDNIALGICYCLVGIFVFQILNVLGKWLAESYPIGMLIFFRSVFALVSSAIMVARSGGKTILVTKRPAAHLLRGAIWLVMLTCSFYAFHLLPVADASAIGFSAPLFVTILARPLLGEFVGARRWFAVTLGFSGVLLIVRPSTNLIEIGALFAVGDAASYALGVLLVREISRTEHCLAIVFYCCVVAAVASTILIPFCWVTPTVHDLCLLVAMGLIGGVAQYLTTQSYRYAPASVVAPFTYSALIWSVLFGFMIWGELPDLPVYIGAGLVVLSSLYLARHEAGRVLVAWKSAAAGD